MIFGRTKPWQNQRQRQLLRACFHVDNTKAHELAINWFNNFDLNDVAYPEHRLLVRLLSRFPKIVLPSDIIARVLGLKRQLWVRGNLNLQASISAFTALDNFDIPWVLTGEAQWFVQPEAVIADSADTVEFTVPDNARSAAVHALVQNGWKATINTADLVAGPVFTQLTKGHGAIRLSKAGALFCYAPEQVEIVWNNRIEFEHSHGRFYLPDQLSAYAIAIGKSHPSYSPNTQWVFDLFNMNHDPLTQLSAISLHPKISRKLSRTIEKLGFYN